MSKGEDKEHNKDVVVNYLHKWSALHQLRHIPDLDTPIQESLSLEGRAYKWWMSLPKEGHPKSWAEFCLGKTFQKTKRIVTGMLGTNVVGIMLRWLNIFPSITS